MEALVAFQRGGGVDSERIGFRDPSGAGDGMGQKVEVLALEVEDCSNERGDEVAWLGEGRFECFQAILGGEGDGEVVDDY